MTIGLIIAVHLSLLTFTFPFTLSLVNAPTRTQLHPTLAPRSQVTDARQLRSYLSATILIRLPG